MSEPDIVAAIWADVEGRGLLADLTTAERRKALDDALRSNLARIGNVSLRIHAAELIRERRSAAFRQGGEIWQRIGGLETIVAALQRAQTGVAP